MASSSSCEYCGATLRSDEQQCSNCGAPNPGYVPPKQHNNEKPRTIEELQAFCAERGMPLQKMRFYIGQDYRGPRAFGIYREGDQFIVYKNKSDGSRAERYRGPDEAYAVNELFQKLKEEHLKRQQAAKGGHRPTTRSGGGSGNQKPPKKNRTLLWIILIAVAVFSVYALIDQNVVHKNDGYYRTGDDTYYHYGSSWYVGDDYGNWVETYDFPAENYEEYYEGQTYDSDWGGSDFTESDTWDDLHSSSGSSSSDDDWGWDYDDDDYDSWDSGDTDWDSDW